MRPFLHRLAPALLALTLAVPAAAEETTLRVLHTTDLHGTLAGWDDANDRPAARGLERIATLVRSERAHSGPLLLLDAGDALSGSALVRVWREQGRRGGSPVTAAMRAMGYDALAIGNHEFDGGRAELEQTAREAGFAFLSANLVDARSGAPLFAPSLVRDFDGLRVGVVGLTTSAVPMLMDSSLCSGLAFLDLVEVARREVARLRGAERCQVVIALAHTGLERDPAAAAGEAAPRMGEVPNENVGWRLANEVPGLDAVILGHTHQSLATVRVGGTLVTQAGSNGGALGRIELRLTRDSAMAPWRVASSEARLVAVTDSTAAEAQVAALVKPHAEATRRALDEVVAQASTPLGSPLGRLGDGPLWRLVHRCQLEASGAEVSFAALFDPTLTLPAGPVRRRDLLRLYPYDNSLGVVRMTGAEVKEALEYAAGMLQAYTADGRTPVLRPDVQGFQFDAVGGLEYSIDLSRPVGDRIVGLLFHDEHLDPRRELRVVANSYRLAGGGDYLALRRAPRVKRIDVSMPELLERHVRARHTLADDAAPAWTTRPDWAGAAERPLLDRLVKQGTFALAEAAAWNTTAPATRADLAYGLGRAFEGGERRPAGVWRHDPRALAAWLDGIVKRGLLGDVADAKRFGHARPADLGTALDWCERVARSKGYALALPREDRAFRRGLTTGIAGLEGAAPTTTLTRAQWLAMLSNLRWPVLRVLETTDFHGAILGGSRERRSGRPTGGSAALAAAIEKERARNPEGTVLLDGGDLFQGTMISNLQYGRPVVEQMNALGYAAAAVGNHEFDWGVDTLVSRVHEMRFAALGANMIERATGRMPRWARSDTTVLRRGLSVGIVGLAYPGTPRVTLPAHVAHLRFDDDSTTAAQVGERLRRNGASVVIGVGHIPAETDSLRRARGDLARLGRVASVDAWLGGHSHNVVNDRVEGRPVIIAGAQGQYLAVLDLVVDPVAKRVVESDPRIYTVYADGPVDSVWTARVTHWNSGVAPIAAEVIGEAAVALHRRRPEATIGDFICDAMRAESKVDIAMQNPGGMRADLDAGPVTRGDVYAVMPFDNTIVVVELTGAQVKLAIEQALRADRVTQVSGVRYEYDPSRPDLQRVTRITLADGSPLDEARVYRVAVNNFMAGGGDQYDALAQGRSRQDTGLPIRSAMESWVRAQGGRPFTLAGDGRIQQVGGR